MCRLVKLTAYLLFALAGLAACSSKDTLLLVAVNSNLEVPAELTKVRAVVRGGQDELLWDRSFELLAQGETSDDGRFKLPLSFSVIPREGNPEIPVKIEIEAIGPVDGDEIVLFTRTAVTKFSRDRTLLLPMFLARRCLTDVCGTGQTCAATGCVDEAIDVLELQSIEPGKETQVIGNRDATPPLITLQTETPTITKMLAIRFDFACNKPPCSFECQLDAMDFQACRSPVIYEVLAEGTHDFAVRGADSGGVTSTGPATYRWSVDTSPPATAISKTPELWSRVLQPSFEFACNEASCEFRCQVDNESPQACRSPHVVGSLADGPHVFIVGASDVAKNSELFPPAYFWNVDTQAPSVRFLSTPPTTTTSRSVSLSFVCDEPPCSFECAQESQTATVCTSPVQYEDLDIGSYEFSVQATDQAGNTSIVVTTAWTVDGDWLSVDAGHDGSCAIARDRSLWCWGKNDYGQLGTGTRFPRSRPRRVGLENDWSSISKGSNYTCGIRSDRTLWCWGGNNNFQLGAGNIAQTYIPVQVGPAINWLSVSAGTQATATCGISEGGGLWCWGSNHYDQFGTGGPSSSRPAQVGTETDWSEVSVANRHTCALKTDNRLLCWGDNSVGQIGIGTTARQTTPVEVVPTKFWRFLTAKELQTCAIDTQDKLWCWGKNNDEQLGDGSSLNRDRPVAIRSGQQWLTVSTHKRHTCATRLDGTLWCWGFNLYGETGRAQLNQSHGPTPFGTDSDWREITGGFYFTCGLKANGSLWCWGSDQGGALGNGQRGDRHVPTRVGTDLDWRAVATGNEHSCGIKGGSELWCWGHNSQMQLGKTLMSSYPDEDFVITPLHIDNNAHRWQTVSAGSDFTCGINENRKLYCWGYNGNGRLGIGNPANSQASITAVRPDLNWQQVSAASGFACAIDESGSAWCWGENRWGQLGNSGTVDAREPVQIAPPQDWVPSSTVAQVATGNNHACLVKYNKSLWCWGSGDLRKTGQSSDADVTVPVRVGTTTQSWTQVDAGQSHTCGQLEDGVLRCWGYNVDGQLGDGTRQSTSGNSVVLATVAGGNEWRALSTGAFETCGIKTDDSLWCWGRNVLGQVGDDSTEVQSLPVRVGTERTWESVSVSRNHSCAIAQDGSLWCWGSNFRAQLGHGLRPYSNQAKETMRP